MTFTGPLPPKQFKDRLNNQIVQFNITEKQLQYCPYASAQAFTMWRKGHNIPQDRNKQKRIFDWLAAQNKAVDTTHYDACIAMLQNQHILQQIALDKQKYEKFQRHFDLCTRKQKTQLRYLYLHHDFNQKGL